MFMRTSITRLLIAPLFVMIPFMGVSTQDSVFDESYMRASYALRVEKDPQALLVNLLESCRYPSPATPLEELAARMVDHENNQQWADNHMDSEDILEFIAAHFIESHNNWDGEEMPSLFMRMNRVDRRIFRQANLSLLLRYADNIVTGELPLIKSMGFSDDDDLVDAYFNGMADDHHLSRISKLVADFLESYQSGELPEHPLQTEIITAYLDFSDDITYASELYQLDGFLQVMFGGEAMFLTSRSHPESELFRWGLEKARQTASFESDDELALTWLILLTANLDQSEVVKTLEYLLLHNPGVHYRNHGRNNILGILSDPFWKELPTHHEVERLLERYITQQEAQLRLAKKVLEEHYERFESR